MNSMSGRIGLDAMITLAAMIVLVTALSTVYSTAIVVVGRAVAVFTIQ